MITLKDIFKFTGIIIISACAVFICALFLNYNADLRAVGALLDERSRPLYDALVSTGNVVSAVSGGCLLATSAVMLAFYIKRFVDSHRKQLGILKALGYSNLRTAGGFAVFGLSVLAGAAVGYAGALCLMPTFYSVQNEDGLLPPFEPSFHFELLAALVIIPSAAFALLSVFYALVKMKTPVLALLKGQSSAKPKRPSDRGGLSFVGDMRRAVLRGRKTLVFFIGFAAFCYSAMVQMSIGVYELSSGMMSLMTLLIGLVLAFVTLFIAVTSAVGANSVSVAVMRAFGYSGRECSSAVLDGYRPAAAVGFAVGTVYQYALLRIAVDVLFGDIENVPELEFDFKALLAAAVSFAVIYEAVMFFCSRKIGRASLKEIMTDCE